MPFYLSQSIVSKDYDDLWECQRTPNLTNCTALAQKPTPAKPVSTRMNRIESR